jgi:hypothetical protein
MIEIIYFATVVILVFLFMFLYHLGIDVFGFADPGNDSALMAAIISI